MSADEKRNLVGASASLVTGRIAVAVLSYAATAVIARTLSPNDWGGFTFIFSVTTLLGAIFDFQASRLVLKDLLDPEVDAGRTIGSYTMLRFALGAVGYIAANAFVIIGGYESNLRNGMLVGGIYLLVAPTWNAVFLYFQSRHWLRSVALVSAASRVLLLAATLAIIVGGSESLVVLIWPGVLAEVFILGALLWIVRRHEHIRFVVEPRRWAGWLRETIPIVLGAAIGTVYFRLDAVMLSQLDNLEAVGLYGIAYKFSDLLAFLPTAVMAPTFTLLVAAWPEQPAEFRRNFRGALLLLCLAAFTLSAGFCAFSGQLIDLLYGARYTPAENAARLVVAGQAIRFFTVLCTLTLVAVRRNVIYAVASIAGLVFNIALNALLIPRYSYGGAAFATVVTELAVLVILVRAVARIPAVDHFPWAPIGRITLASVAALVSGLALQAVMPWPIAAVISAVVCVAFLHLVGIDGPGGLRVLPTLLRHVETTTADIETPGMIPG